MGLTKEQLFKSIRKVFNYTNSVISPINEQLDQAKAKLDTVQKYQKYVNTGLDYCYLTISSAYSAQKISTDDIIGFDTAKECNNMEYDLSNHTITLKQGKTYKISCNLCTVYGEVQYELRDITNDIGLRLIRSTAPDSTSLASSIDCVCVYTPETDCQIQVKVLQSKATSSTVNVTGVMPQYPTVVTDFGYFIAEEIGREIVIDPTSSLSKTQDTPVGSIISYMGTTAPDHYLICDGAKYNIEDYKQLADFINTNYGSYNFFGGDGTTTFAVPDLRGEFLRGSGTATRNTGSGAYVGVHQDGTALPSGYMTSTSGNIYLPYDSESSHVLSNYDSKINSSSKTAIFSKNTTETHGYDACGDFSVRPTNTSVNYCIKYESINALVCNWNSDSVYSTDEQVVGRWIDGKPLYRKTIEFTVASSTDNDGTVDVIVGGTSVTHYNRYLSVSDNIVSVVNINGMIDGSDISFNVPIPVYFSDSKITNAWYSKDNDKLVVRGVGYEGMSAKITVEYTKTTDSATS